MKTFSAKPHEVKRDWYIVDASDKVLGRLAAAVAHRLRGKHKAEFTPHVDSGDYIVVVNAEKLRVTGNKARDKMYYRHSTYPGGTARERALRDVLRRAMEAEGFAVYAPEWWHFDHGAWRRYPVLNRTFEEL